tara:strand:- start:1846 stop:2031 length:186 start_codon:yes stop_codon:yes gene_type:complete
MSLAETYKRHQVTQHSPFADIFDAALEYYVSKHRAAHGDPEEPEMFELEDLADTAASRFAN